MDRAMARLNAAKHRSTRKFPRSKQFQSVAEMLNENSLSYRGHEIAEGEIFIAPNSFRLPVERVRELFPGLLN